MVAHRRVTAPAGKRMGHAGAIISGGKAPPTVFAAPRSGRCYGVATVRSPAQIGARHGRVVGLIATSLTASPAATSYRSPPPATARWCNAWAPVSRRPIHFLKPQSPVAQINLLVGDIAGNARQVIEPAARLRGSRHRRVSGLTLTGYPPEICCCGAPATSACCCAARYRKSGERHHAGRRLPGDA